MDLEKADFQCPICDRCFPPSAIDAHVNSCLNQSEDATRLADRDEQDESPVPQKRLKTGINSMIVDKQATGHQTKTASWDFLGISRKIKPKPLSAQNHDTVIESSSAKPANTKPFVPLAEEMRPKDLGDYIGQEHVLGRKTLLRTLLDSQQIPSMVIWGPPGCGKTTLARIIAAKTRSDPNTRFVQLSATTSGIGDVKQVIKVAKNESTLFKRKSILFVDEIHRFNKLQQDSFLPHVEDGTITLIGATTENPSFYVNNALLSRCRVVTLDKLSVENVKEILSRAIEKLGVKIVGLEGDKKTTAQPQCTEGLCIEEKAVTTLAHLCDGDARVALNSLESAIESARATNCSVVGVEDVKEGLQRSHIQYDRAGEEHYNCISALIKSMRGGDDNAAIYWLSRMLEGGEDPKFIARRLIVFASEDVGVADSQSLVLAVATYQACHFIGMPECALNLAHCVVHLARAPKSIETYSALKKARQSIRQHEGPLPHVPLHLRNAPTKLMKDLKYGVGYQYNPACTEPVVQDYLPKELLGVNFFAKDPS